MNDKTWLMELKVGDKVFVDNDSIGTPLTVGQVSRVTATRIVVGVSKYTKKTGLRVGPKIRFYFPKILPFDEVRWVALELKRRDFAAVADARKLVCGGQVTPDQARRILAMMREDATAENATPGGN